MNKIVIMITVLTYLCMKSQISYQFNSRNPPQDAPNLVRLFRQNNVIYKI